MSMFNDKTLKGVTEAVAKIMGEELKGNQHKIDANKNGKVDAHDFKLLRAKKTMKEEEQLDELSKSTVKSYVMKKMDKMSDEPVSKNQYLAFRRFPVLFAYPCQPIPMDRQSILPLRMGHKLLSSHSTHQSVSTYPL